MTQLLPRSPGCGPPRPRRPLTPSGLDDAGSGAAPSAGLPARRRAATGSGTGRPARSAPDRSAARRSAPVRSASARSAPRRSAPIRWAPRRSAPRRSTARRSAPTRSAPRRSSAGPRGGRARERARAPEQGVHPLPVGRDVERIQRSAPPPARPSVSSRAARSSAMERPRRGKLERLGQVPEQLVELAHDAEGREHRGRDLGIRPPVGSGEGLLGDPLSRAEAVVGGAAREPAVPQAGVDAAPEVRLQVRTRLPGGLVDREVRRGGEGGRDAAQPDAALAVGTEDARDRGPGRARPDGRRGGACGRSNTTAFSVGHARDTSRATSPGVNAARLGLGDHADRDSGSPPVAAASASGCPGRPACRPGTSAPIPR